jgi:hypothetical protein
LKVSAHWAAAACAPSTLSLFSQLLDKDPTLSGGGFAAEVLKSS